MYVCLSAYDMSHKSGLGTVCRTKDGVQLVSLKYINHFGGLFGRKGIVLTKTKTAQSRQDWQASNYIGCWNLTKTAQVSITFLHFIPSSLMAVKRRCCCCYGFGCCRWLLLTLLLSLVPLLLFLFTCISTAPVVGARTTPFPIQIVRKLTQPEARVGTRLRHINEITLHQRDRITSIWSCHTHFWATLLLGDTLLYPTLSFYTLIQWYKSLFIKPPLNNNPFYYVTV